MASGVGIHGYPYKGWKWKLSGSYVSLACSTRSCCADGLLLGCDTCNAIHLTASGIIAGIPTSYIVAPTSGYGHLLRTQVRVHGELDLHRPGITTSVRMLVQSVSLIAVSSSFASVLASVDTQQVVSFTLPYKGWLDFVDGPTTRTLVLHANRYPNF